LGVEEGAIAVGHLDEALTLARGPDEGVLELRLAHGQGVRQRGNFFASDPHVARVARAAPAAAKALELKPFVVPRPIRHV